MEYIVFFAVFSLFIVGFVVKEIMNDRKKKKEFEKTLRINFGVLREREYKVERFERMDRYFRKHPEESQLDDITWNDLGMNDLFKLMNHTYSAIGEEYLYHTLRSAGRSAAELEHFEKLVCYFSGNEDQRVAFQLEMAKLGYMGKFSLYDYLDNLNYLGERSNKKSIVCDLLYIPCILLMPFQLPAALCGLAAIMIYNITTYFKEKGDIEPYIISFRYMLKLLDCCENIEKLSGIGKESEPAQELSVISEMRRKMEPMRRGSFLLLSGNGVIGGNPLEMFLDYVRMALHVDLIKFNNMLSVVRDNIDTVDSLVTCLGRLETSVAIGAFRKGLENSNGYAIPEFCDSTVLEMEDGYHPMLSEPVKNSISAERGVLLTGSNASGKSTFLKTVAINAVMAQTVHTCSAKQYKAPLFRIFSSMSLRDDLSGGDSYYIVEIKALGRVLKACAEAGRPVLCFVDEVLRGTNTVERIAASTQILRSLHKESIICFAATHDIELTELLEKDYDNYHFEEEVKNGDVLFSYKLLEGKATTRNAIKLLEIIGYDREIVEKAEKLAMKFTSEGAWT